MKLILAVGALCERHAMHWGIRAFYQLNICPLTQDKHGTLSYCSFLAF
jgi:hypothetical protein